MDNIAKSCVGTQKRMMDYPPNAAFGVNIDCSLKDGTMAAGKWLQVIPMQRTHSKGSEHACALLDDGNLYVIGTSMYRCMLVVREPLMCVIWIVMKLMQGQCI